MAKNVRTEFQILSDKVKIAKYYLQGKTQNEIALEIGVTRQQISYDLKKIIQEWKEERLKDIEEKILIELEKLNLIESEAWEAWSKSKKDAEKITENETKDGVFTSHSLEGQSGHKPFLDMIFKCVEKRLQILGFLVLKNPKKDKEEEDNLELIEAEIELPNNGR